MDMVKQSKSIYLGPALKGVFKQMFWIQEFMWGKSFNEILDYGDILVVVLDSISGLMVSL